MTRRATLVIAALYTFALVVIFGCGSGGGGGSPTNPGGANPTFNLTFPATGHSQSFTFADAGTWNYRCSPHGSSGMTGSVTVSASAVDDSAVVNVGPGNTFTFSPSSVSIKPGGYVRWVNQSNMTNHTVTRP